MYYVYLNINILCIYIYIYVYIMYIHIYTLVTWTSLVVTGPCIEFSQVQTRSLKPQICFVENADHPTQSRPIPQVALRILGNHFGPLAKQQGRKLVTFGCWQQVVSRVQELFGGHWSQWVKLWTAQTSQCRTWRNTCSGHRSRITSHFPYKAAKN